MGIREVREFFNIMLYIVGGAVGLSLGATYVESLIHKSKNSLKLEDLNNDSFPDYIIKEKEYKYIFLSQPDGTYLLQEDAEKKQRENLRNTIESKLKDVKLEK